MRIGYVLDLFPSVYQTYVLDELLQLEKAGLEIEVFSLQAPSAAHPQHDRLQQLRAPIHCIPSPARALGEYAQALGAALARFPLRYLQGLAQAVRRPGRMALLSFMRGVYLSRLPALRRVQHLHAHFALGANVVAMVAAHLCGLTFSFTTHAVDLFARPVGLCESLRAAGFAVTISEYNRDFIARSCGEHLAQRVRVVRAGIDPAAFAVGQRPANGRPRILSVGRLVAKKGHRHLIEALALLRRRGYDFEVVVVGEGPERPALARLIDERGLSTQARLLGAVAQQEVRQLYAESDVFVLPCVVACDGDRDGIPVSLMEAMASGLPVVSTYCSAIPELITHGREGLLVEPGDVDGLSAALERLLTEAAARERLGQAGRERVLREFDVRRNAGELVALFAQTVEGGSSR